MGDKAKFCSVEGCHRAVCAKDYCKLHYERWRKHGDPNIVKKGGTKEGFKPNPATIARRAESLRRPLKDRFDSKYIPEPNSGCWIWIGSAGNRKFAYGQLRVNGRAVTATHISLELVGRPVPHGHFACHRCDTPLCVNPDHLFVGTQADNVRDMMLKGRHNHSGLDLGRGVHHEI